MIAKPLYIVADDLTGAADCAARCFGYGYTANVYIAPNIVNHHSDVYSFTTDSRSLTPFEAGQRTREILRAVSTPGVLWYKKFDSTLRGNIGSEIDAFIDVLGFEIALVCPAFPLQNRGLFGGSLVLNGHIVEAAHLPAILSSQSKYPSSHIPLRLLESDPAALLREIIDKHNQGIKIFSLDALSENHLEKIVDVYHDLPYNTLLSGSAGLVSALVSRGEQKTPAERNRKSMATGKRVLIAIGSGSDAAHRQIEYLKAQQDVKVLSTEDRFENLDFPTVVLHLPPPAKGIPLDSAEGRKALEKLVIAAMKFIDVQKPDLLIVTGGDTSIELLKRLGVERLEIEAELFPGIPFTSGAGSNGKAYKVVLKPGSFGDDAIFDRLLKLLRKVDSPSIS